MIVEKRGMKGAITITGWLNLLGVGLMTFAAHWWILAFGRYVSGELRNLMEGSYAVSLAG